MPRPGREDSSPGREGGCPAREDDAGALRRAEHLVENAANAWYPRLGTCGAVVGLCPGKVVVVVVVVELVLEPPPDPGPVDLQPFTFACVHPRRSALELWGLHLSVVQLFATDSRAP